MAATLASRLMGILAGVSLVAGLSAMWIAARRRGTISKSASAGRPGPLMRAAVRYLGPLPPGAPESVRLSWMRSVGLKIALPFLPVFVVAMIIIKETWAYVLFAVWFVLWAEGLRRISRDIKRARPTETPD